MNFEKARKNHPRDSSPNTPDELDRLLAAHFAPNGELAPSSGFASQVMEDVKAQSSTASPIAFPWRRVLPGIIAVLCAMAVFATLLLRLARAAMLAGSSGRGPVAGVQLARSIPHLTSLEQALCWSVLAVCLSIGLAIGSMHLSSRGS